MSDWLWEVKQCEDQREDVLEYRRIQSRMLEIDEVNRRQYRRMKEVCNSLIECT